jgi:hypothetical protein
VLAALPEGSVPEIERFLKFLLKDFLPSQRSAAQRSVKHLPQRRSGGAPSKMPNPADCRKICDEMNELHHKGVLLGVAQKQVAKKWIKSVRMVQRIWAQRKAK